MKTGFLRFFRRRDTKEDITILQLLDNTLSLWDGFYVPKKDHEARVRELLEASNVNMERRRQAEQEARDAELQTIRAVRLARTNLGIVHAVDWAREHPEVDTLKAITAYVGGFNQQNCPNDQLFHPWAAGVKANKDDVALRSAAKNVGITQI